MGKLFKINSQFEPRGDQNQAIAFLSSGVLGGAPYQTLLGVTGSGKTFTMAKIIEKCRRPSLIIAHNKTLAAQLYREFKEFFPFNAVHYFVSYYDYYQPEAYIPTTDTFIEKDASINQDLDQMRHAATQALFDREDVIIVSSVSCIYGIGAPEDYYSQSLSLVTGQEISRRSILEQLVNLQYHRNDVVLMRGNFRVRGDTIEVFGTGENDALRIQMFGDVIESLVMIDPLRGRKTSENLEKATIFPASHYVPGSERMPTVIKAIKTELEVQSAVFAAEKKYLERQRIIQRTEFDMEMLELTGHCSGIENYSRHLTGRSAGEPPPTLLDYFPDNALIFIDESHVTIPQIRAMYRGDRSRKQTLIKHGFRLPSALDNRPLTFEEFLTKVRHLVFVSATPGEFEYKMSGERVAEQIIRPTGLVDPVVEIRPAKGQVDDLYDEIAIRARKGERTLVTTLTKRMAEDLADYYRETGLKVAYLHSEIDTLERIKIIRELRMGKYDALLGVNLLREGLDIPEVSLVAIIDADREGFLRSTTALIQTVGRCARNADGKAILYADRITGSMQAAIDEMNRRRSIQTAFNREHGITPLSITKRIDTETFRISDGDYLTIPTGGESDSGKLCFDEIEQKITALEKEMFACAEALNFEEAALIRDQIRDLKKQL